MSVPTLKTFQLRFLLSCMRIEQMAHYAFCTIDRHEKYQNINEMFYLLMSAY